MPHPSPADIARPLLSTLDVLHGFLETTANPHREALALLGFRSAFAGVSQPYHDEAFTIWEKILKRDPEDWDATHHLAIMYHARAIDCETGPNLRLSDEDWIQAMLLWSRLFKADSFWQDLSDRTAKRIEPQVWEVLRSQLPVLLLSVHYDIAFDPAKKRIYRARFHLDMVRSSPFSSSDQEAAQRRAYSLFIRNIPASVWQYGETDRLLIEKALDRIEEFLRMEPACLPGIDDAIRLQCRVLGSRATDLHAVGNDAEECREILSDLGNSAQRWRPYFNQLAQRDLSTVDDEVREKAGFWYRLMGQVYSRIDDRKTAAEFFSQGLESTLREDSEHRLCSEELGQVLALMARERAHQGSSGAKEFCSKVSQREHLNRTSLFVLANAYALLEAFDEAEAMCQRGLTLEVDSNDLDTFEKNLQDEERLRDYLSHVHDIRRWHQAREIHKEASNLMNKGHFEEALVRLDKGAQICPDFCIIYFTRSQCHLVMGSAEAAHRDLEDFRRLIKDAPETSEAADNLEREIDNLAEQTVLYGPKGHRLRQQAITEANAGNHEQAIALLREVLAECPRKGRDHVKMDLAMVFFNAGHEKLGKSLEDSEATDQERSAWLDQSMALVREAIEFEPEGGNAVKLLNNVHQIKQAFELYGPAGFKLQQTAVGAYNNGDFDKAVEFLEQLINQCPLAGRKEVSKQLSASLTGGAIRRYNGRASRQHPFPTQHNLGLTLTFPSIRFSSVTEDLNRALALDPTNSQARNALKAIGG